MPRDVATLSSIMAFCLANIVCLLRDCPPLLSTKRATICAVVLGSIVWACTHIAIGVVREGMRSHDRGRSA
jgi:hypothetical protein